MVSNLLSPVKYHNNSPARYFFGIDLAELAKTNLIGNGIKRAKVILAGNIDRAITLVGIKVTAGARKAIEAAGGKIEQ